MLYKAVLSVLCEPTAITAIGGVLLAFGSGLFRGMKKVLKHVLGWLYKSVGGEEEVREKEPHQLTLKQVRVNNEITTLLEQLCVKLDCARVCVLQYHNGENFSLSNPMFKISTTYEATAPGFAEVAPLLTNVPISTIPVFTSALLSSQFIPMAGVKEEKFCPKGGVCELRDTPIRLVSFTRDTLKLGRIRLSLEKCGVEKMFACSLATPTGGLLGALVIQYHDITHADENVRENVCEICKMQQYLQTILWKR